MSGSGNNRGRATSFTGESGGGAKAGSGGNSTFGNFRSGKDNGKVITVMASPARGTDHPVEVVYTDIKVIGNGSFGVVYQARLVEDSETVAIKKVLQDKRFKNRELQIMRKLEHCNIVDLKYFFYSQGDKKDEVYLNLILEFIPETVYRVARHYNKQKQTIPVLFIKLYMYNCSAVSLIFIPRASVIVTSNPKIFWSLQKQAYLNCAISALLKY